MPILIQVRKLNNLFFFDLDGTLCVGNQISSKTKKAVQLLRNQGDLVILCTGRCLGQMKTVLDEIEVDGWITNNGAFGAIHKECFYKNEIPTNLIEQLLSKSMPVGILSEDCYGILNDNKDIKNAFCEYFKLDYPEILEKDYIYNHSIYSLGVYSLKDITNTIKELPMLRFMKVCPMGYDVVYQGVSKALPIQKLRTMFPKSVFYGFGDNVNDIEMLQEVDVAIAMGQAPKIVQNQCDYVTKPPSEDGIWYALAELLKLI